VDLHGYEAGRARSDVFIEVKGVDHAGNETKITENPTVGLDA
jgi:hypothetical protein